MTAITWKCDATRPIELAYTDPARPLVAAVGYWEKDNTFMASTVSVTLKQGRIEVITTVLGSFATLEAGKRAVEQALEVRS